MTSDDIQILVKYLERAVVPQAEQAQFVKAFEHLLAVWRQLATAA
jgi:hypothetical protein